MGEVHEIKTEEVEIKLEEALSREEEQNYQSFTELYPPAKKRRCYVAGDAPCGSQSTDIKYENEGIVAEAVEGNDEQEKPGAEPSNTKKRAPRAQYTRGRYSILPEIPGELIEIEAMLNLPEIDTNNIDEYIGEMNSVEEPLKTMRFLARYGIIRNAWQCNQCGNKMSLVHDVSLNDKCLWRCSGCRFPGNALRGKLSIRHQSWLSESKLKMGTILRLAAQWAIQPTLPYVTVAHMYGISTSAVADYYHFFRDACQNWFKRTAVHTQLGGFGKIVEVEETKFFTQRYIRGVKRNDRPYEWILAAVDKETEYMALIPIQTRTREELIAQLREYIAPGSIILNCDWEDYGGIHALRDDYLPYDHDAEFIKWDDHRIMNPRNAAAIAFRDTIRKVQGYNDKMPTYIYQYLFRRINSDTKMFQNLMYEIQQMYEPDEERVEFS